MKLSFMSPIGDSCFFCKHSWHSKHTGSSHKRQRVLSALQLLLHLWSSGQQRSGISCRISSTSGWCGSAGSCFSFSSSSLVIVSSDQRSSQLGKTSCGDVAYRSVKVCREKFLWRLPHVIYVSFAALFPLLGKLPTHGRHGVHKDRPFGADPSLHRAALAYRGRHGVAKGWPLGKANSDLHHAAPPLCNLHMLLALACSLHSSVLFHSPLFLLLYLLLIRFN